MSWYGTHVKNEKNQPISKFCKPATCKLCKYRIRAMRYAGVMFESFKCSRCGNEFPVKEIEKELWLEKLIIG